MHTNKETVRGLTGKLSPSSWKLGVGAYVKLYTSASTIGTNRRNRRSVQLQGYNLTGIMQTWQDSVCDWSAAMDGHRLFRESLYPGNAVGEVGSSCPLHERAAGTPGALPRH